MTDTRKLKILKYFIYVIFIFLLFVLENTPAFLAWGGIKLRIMMPCAVAVAIFEGEFAGGLLGAYCGLLYDFSSYTIFGFYSLQLLGVCTLVGLLYVFYIKTGKFAALATGFFVLLWFSLTEFYFYFVIWKYPGSLDWFLSRILPVAVLSAPLTVLFYLAESKFYNFFAEKIDERK